MITRQEYLSGMRTHREYYAQFVTEQVRKRLAYIGIDRIVNSTDEHFNDIPLHEWDNLSRQPIAGLDEQLRACGDYLSLSAYTCVFKEAARQIFETDHS